jgi:formate dehydrogenase subunit gamma
MSTVIHGQHIDPAIVVARGKENVLIGHEIIRHRRSARLIHWGVALSFLISMLSGMPIWTPVFGWMATFLGGLEVCRWLHPWAGIFFFVFSVFQFFAWLADMRFVPGDKDWLGPKLFSYMRYRHEAIDTGKYNGGQKIFFYAVSLGALGFLLTGIVMWFPLEFPIALRQISIVLHDITFIFFLVGITSHIYMGTAAEPGTFGSMVVGTVTRSWARLHHPGWYREVTGKDPREGQPIRS